ERIAPREACRTHRQVEVPSFRGRLPTLDRPAVAVAGDGASARPHTDLWVVVSCRGRVALFLRCASVSLSSRGRSGWILRRARATSRASQYAVAQPNGRDTSD